MSELRHASLAAVLLLLTTARLHAEPVAEPYDVWVGSGGAAVFSGPGSDYYGTQQLPAGAKCEVYEELRDGWLAIRPPAGSYSLVLRSSLGPVEAGAAKVLRANTPSRVGSLLSDKYSSVHVRLDEGEPVQVIDDGAFGNSQWVTIAPPAGEFRWIREADVVLSPPDNTVNEQLSGGEAVVAIATTSAPEGDASQGDAGWQQRDDETAGEPAIRITGHNEPSQLEPTPAPPLVTDRPTTSGSVSTKTNLSFAKQLDGLEIALSRRVAGPVDLWVFEDLKQQAAQLQSQATSATERQAVDGLAARLGRFVAIGERYRTNKQPAAAGLTSIVDSSQTSNSITPIDSQYDAVGVLRPVVAKQGNAPPYALVDDAGKVVTFITPSPSLNLQQHLGQRVGVSGTRGFLPEYRSRNIQTARVIPIDGALQR